MLWCVCVYQLLPVAVAGTSQSMYVSSPSEPAQAPPLLGTGFCPVGQRATQTGSEFCHAPLTHWFYTETNTIILRDASDSYIHMYIRQDRQKTDRQVDREVTNKTDAEGKESRKSVCSHFQCLVKDWAESLFLHWCFLLTVRWLIRQEICLHIPTTHAHAHTHTS